jgi:putative ABC transport system permease protein
VDKVWNGVPNLMHLTPVVFLDTTVQNDLHTYTWTVMGARPAAQDIMKLDDWSSEAQDERRRER